MRKVIALGRQRPCFEIPFGPGALISLNPLVACTTSKGLVNFSSLAEAYHDLQSHQPDAVLDTTSSPWAFFWG
jgi:hypothetical protein